MSEETAHNCMEVVAKNLVEDYVKQADWRVNENANMAYSLQGLNNYIREEVTKYYWMNYIYSNQVKQAHVDGRFHLHDSGSLSGYCMGLDLEDLLEVGFYGGPGKVRSGAPKHLRAALGQLVNLMYSSSGEFAGAVAVSNLDTLMAPFIYYDNLNKEAVKQAVQEFIYNMNVPTRVGFQSVFSNCTLDYTVPKHMADKPVLIGGKRMEKTYKEFQKEMDLFNECFFEVMNDGDAEGRIFSFPIPTVNITKDFDWDNPKYDAMWKNTAKYGQPYFCNYVASDLDPADAMSMCCRLRIDKRELKHKGGLFGANPLTGSVSVCTINFPRLGYLHKNDEEGFFRELDEVLDLAKEALETRRRYVEERTTGNLYPIMKYYLRKTHARFGEYWTNHFSTIATLGMNECILNMFGYGIGDSRGREFAIKIMNHVRKRITQFQIETGHQYNLEQAPAESCFIGDTEVQTMTGSRKIKDLSDDTNDVYVYSWDEDASKVVLRKMVVCKKTSDSAELVRVRFTNGQELICTPNHPFGVRVFNMESGKKVEEIMWVPAGLLKPGNRIKSDYITFKDGNKASYVLHNSHQWQHQIVSEYFNGKLKDGYVVHHKDGNKSNNVKDNLLVLTESEHKALHLRENQKLRPEKYLVGIGEKNHFYGKHHSNRTKAILRAKAKDPEKVKKLVEMVRSPEMRKRYSEIAKAKTSEQTSRYKHNIDTNEIVRLYQQGLTVSTIAKKIGNGCTYSVVKGRLKKLGILQANHIVESVEVLPYKAAVYNLEVEGTHNYFVGGDKGVLVHNCSYRFAKIDKKKYPDIIVADNETVEKDGVAPFYTNSTQLPVNYTDDIFEMMDNQSAINALYTGGSVQHLYLGERVKDINAVKQLVKTIFENYEIPYISITPTFSVCPVHGYLAGEHKYCPHCKSEKLHKIDLEKERLQALLDRASKGEL